jgi:Ni,Fe-hydrogenase III large subunit
MSTLTRPNIDAGVVEVSRLLRGPAGRPGRLVCVFGSKQSNSSPVSVHYIVDVPDQGYRVLRETGVTNGAANGVANSTANGTVQSITPVTPAAAWYERELQDRYGVELSGHPDPRPLLLHDKNQGEYPFLKAEGEGVCEVAVGPVHAGIIEPGHFRFSVVGDNVLFLELRHFYTHKGTEKLFEGAPVGSAQMIAESVSGDNCFAHAVAYSQAIEEAHGAAVPWRAESIRLIGLELERMMAHIADVGALSNDVAFVLPAAYCSRIKEDLLQASTRVMGTRYWRGIAVPGGVTRDLDDSGAVTLGKAVERAAADFAKIAGIILDRPSVQARFEAAGILKRSTAEDFAVVGPVARASGIDIDVRRDHPYGTYKRASITVPSFHYGDVSSRVRVRIDEAAISAKLIVETLKNLPGRPIRAELPRGVPFEGFSSVESPRGELLYWIKGENGTISRCYIKSPSFQNWPALPHAVAGNVIADFPLINKSFNLSYSGCDR